MSETVETTNYAEDWPATREDLIARIQAGCDEIRRTVWPLSDAAQAGPSTSRDWAVKDHLVHLARWAEGMVALLDTRGRFEVMGLDEAWVFAGANEDQINDVIYEQGRHFTALEARAAFDAAFACLIATIASRDFSALRHTYSHYQPDEPGEDSGRPILSWVAGNSYEHCAQHLPWIRARMAQDEVGTDATR
jgi:hypothetical protein